MKKLLLITILIITTILTTVGVRADCGYSIVVNKKTNCVTVYNGEGKPVKAMLCSVGLNPKSTPSGTFYTSQKYRWRYLYGDVYGQYATRICGHILFHSVYYKKQSEDTLKTAEYNKLGTAASMGCIRLTVADAKWIYDNCGAGTRVTILSADTDPLPRPSAIKLTERAAYPNWDPTDPAPNNPWKNEGVKFTLPDTKPTVMSADEIPSDELGKILREGVTAYDAANNVIHFDISCNFPPAVPGVYPIKYFARDILGNYGEAYTEITVVAGSQNQPITELQ